MRALSIRPGWVPTLEVLAICCSALERLDDTTDNVITFRMRWIDGVTLENRVTYEGNQFKIMSIKEIGRRVGLDITCERVGPQ
jgi:hypothetical protein